MKIDIITYKDELQQDLKPMLGDYLNLVAREVKHVETELFEYMR